MTALATFENILTIIADSNAFQTFVGAVGGAGLIYAMDRKRSSNAQQQRNLRIINLTLISLISTKEALINFKEQNLPPIREEMENIGRNTKPAADGKINLVPLEKMMRTFAGVEFFELPDTDELSSIAGKHHNLLRFAYYYRKNLHELQESLSRREDLIEKLLDLGRNIPLQQFILLRDLSASLMRSTDHALIFAQKIEAIVYQICDEILAEKREGVVKGEIAESKRYLLPPDTILPEM